MECNFQQTKSLYIERQITTAMHEKRWWRRSNIAGCEYKISYYHRRPRWSRVTKQKVTFSGQRCVKWATRWIIEINRINCPGHVNRGTLYVRYAWMVLLPAVFLIAICTTGHVEVSLLQLGSTNIICRQTAVTDLPGGHASSLTFTWRTASKT